MNELKEVNLLLRLNWNDGGRMTGAGCEKSAKYDFFDFTKTRHNDDTI